MYRPSNKEKFEWNLMEHRVEWTKSLNGQMFEWTKG